jgi:hypothetical protein
MLRVSELPKRRFNLYLASKKIQQGNETLTQKSGWAWWSAFVIIASQEVEIGRLWFEASSSKVSRRTYLKNTLALGSWSFGIKWLLKNVL